MMRNDDSTVRAWELIEDADAVLIGAGAGLSASAGLRYSGSKFEHDFSDFISKYGMTDLYTSSFYPFKTEEERWAYWARHIYMARFEPDAFPLYKDLLRLVNKKDYFVITTNVDAQFRKAGFSPERIFEVQGDYGLNQCACGCHDTLYDNEMLVKRMLRFTADCRIPSGLVPRCPECGGLMDVHIRKDAFFVQDSAWAEAYRRYNDFMVGLKRHRAVVLLELGVGFNTPTIIRYPFEMVADGLPCATLVRVNEAETESAFLSSGGSIVAVRADIMNTVSAWSAYHHAAGLVQKRI